MNKGTVEIKLRPIKHAFLVRPDDERSILRAIELNSLLWGGMYNPIVPTYKVLPQKWARNHDIFKFNAKELIKGYIDAYDPDFLVPLGKCKNEDYSWLNRKIINDNEIDKTISETGDVGYGVGLYEILNGFIKNELKFVRKYPVDFKLFNLERKYLVFLASVFGKLSSSESDQLEKHWMKHLDAKVHAVQLDNYQDHISGFYMRKLLNYTIEAKNDSRFSRGDTILVLDAVNTSDIIDYWNLRAIGWKVLPIPIQSLESESVKELASRFIEDNSGVSRHNKQIYFRCSVISSKRSEHGKVKEFLTSLKLKPDSNAQGSRFILRYYPRIWDEWAREKDGANCCELVVNSVEQDFGNIEDDFSLRTVDPEFAAAYTEGDGPRYANEITTSIYSNDDLYAEVIPEGKDNLTGALSYFGVDEWRFSKRAISFLTRHKNGHIFLKIPKAEEVFTGWMKDNGLDIKLSQPGKIAKQIIKLLGGKFGVNLIANKHFISLLKKMESSNEVNINDYWMGKNEFWAVLNKIANTRLHKSEPSSLLQSYMEKKIFQLGVKVQCNTCSRFSWFDINSLNYTVQCKYCFEKFDIPTHSPDDLVWCYRTIGPFNLPKRASGVLPSLLTLRIFTNLLGHEPTTPMLSFETSLDNKRIEVDLGLFYRENRFNSNESARLIFAECKGENDFEREDIERMWSLAKKFPSSVLVFSTLKDNLTSKEMKILKPLVNKCRRYYKSNEPYNPVLILTKTELFADIDLSYAWKEKGGKYAVFGKHFYGNKLLGFCDATQQIYLGMQPWGQWVWKEFERKRERKKKIAK